LAARLRWWTALPRSTSRILEEGKGRKGEGKRKGRERGGKSGRKGRGER